MRPSTRRRVGPLTDRPLTLRGLLRAFWPQISVTWGLTLAEVVMFALIPLLIGKAIDGLLVSDLGAFIQLGAVLGGLVLLGTLRRVYDTRAYGLMRVELGKELARRSAGTPVSQLNARLGMGRELVDFLESEALSKYDSGCPGSCRACHPGRLPSPAGIVSDGSVGRNHAHIRAGAQTVFPTECDT
ncbi:ABC transporter six-transmembrane domain-containing protein [Phaeobacter sp. BS23]|uniref:ABC transporter six-transmembrane domain-containing protein n=1 Tax=Phaeobacter sp. BS23 TaxID=2907239 RepID=UPI00386DEB97